jgi:hypothetical protein
MPAKLPEEVRNKLRPELNVIWFGHRALFEIVSEVSEAVFSTMVILFVAVQVDSRTGLGGWLYWLAVLMLATAVANKTIIEIVRWKNEWFIVSEDTANGGGQVDKVWWTLRGKRHVQVVISKGFQDIDYAEPWGYIIWGFITGEKMYQVNLRSVTHAFLEGRRISPRFYYAIQALKGAQAQTPELDLNDLTMLRHIKQALVDGLIDVNFAKMATKSLINRTVMGPYHE